MTTDDKLDLILAMLQQHDKRFEQIDKRFEQIDRRFDEVKEETRHLREDMDKRFDEVKEEIRNIKHDVRADRDKLEKVYESRDKVKITFGWQWGMVSFFIALMAAGITKIFE